ncbi:MAG: S8 family serine peptidase [Actinomycetales bacterium]|nr:S8 family serine peptidase [Actinomycetales bacterium]
MASATLVALGVAPAMSASAADHGGNARGKIARAENGDLQRYIIRLGEGANVGSIARAITGSGRVIGVQQALGTVVVETSPEIAAAVEALPGVVAVTEDGVLQAQSLGFNPSSYPGAMTNVTRVVGANTAWQGGYTGDGVDVALIDTGVSPVAALNNATKVVVGPDLSFESQDPNLTFLDSYGHGTHMAGIIAGREVAKGSGSSYASDTGNFYGMAPDSRLISLKVADNQGAVDVSQVVAAIDWVVQSKNLYGLNIKVLNLSYGSASPQSPEADPLSWAAEVAWKKGIVVVASAGNEGDNQPGLSNPAYNPWILAVGAADTKGTDAKTDDVVPGFSAKQGGNWGTRAPDIVAPGVSIVAPGVVNSNVYAANSSARVGNGFIKGSGTSQAAAVVSGAVACLLQARPNLSPDQVKAVLKSTADSLPGQQTKAQGSGELDLAEALTASVPATQNNPNGNGTGSIESARGGFHVALDGVELRGEIDIMGKNWNNNQTALDAWNLSAIKADGSFNTTPWTGTAFVVDDVSWAGRTWGGRTWGGRTWAGAWGGRTWGGRTWGGRTWTGTAWSSGSWSSPVQSPSWAAQIWAGSGWK